MSTPASHDVERPAIVRSGRVRIKGQGSLSGWTWKAKSLVLTDEALVIPGNKIPLDHITKVERVDLKPYCLLLEVKNRTYHLSFENDGELYDWQDDVYARCPKIVGGGVGSPFGFVHNVHVGADAIADSFTGLPSQWNDLINGRTINNNPALATQQQQQQQQQQQPQSVPQPQPQPQETQEPRVQLEKIDLDAGRRSSTGTNNLLYDAPALGYHHHHNPRRHTNTHINKDSKGNDDDEDDPQRASSPAILDGNLSVKIAGGLFSGWWMWKHRWLVLRSKTLTIYDSPNSTSGITIPLKDIDKIELVNPQRLRIITGGSSGAAAAANARNPHRLRRHQRRRTLLVSFTLDTQAHTWQNAIGPRTNTNPNARVTVSAPNPNHNGAEISHPWNFVHRRHVSVDPDTGKFSGLPNEWKHLVEHPSVAQQQSQPQQQ